jgi:hypothetical protein
LVCAMAGAATIPAAAPAAAFLMKVRRVMSVSPSPSLKIKR